MMECVKGAYSSPEIHLLLGRWIYSTSKERTARGIGEEIDKFRCENLITERKLGGSGKETQIYYLTEKKQIKKGSDVESKRAEHRNAGTTINDEGRGEPTGLAGSSEPISPVRRSSDQKKKRNARGSQRPT